MSDTPRTDERTYPADCLGKTLVVNADWARVLESENNALREAGHLAEKIIVQRTDEIRHLERENAALRHSEENLASTVRGLEFELEKAQTENAALRVALAAPDRQALAYAIADELHHPSNGIHLSREGIAGVVFAHLCGAAIDAARKEAQP